MSGGNVRRLQDARKKRAAREAHTQAHRTTREASELRRAERPSRAFAGRKRRQSVSQAVGRAYRQRRLLAGSLALLCALALFVAVLGQSRGAAEAPLPINPNEAGPDTIIAKAGGMGLSTPIRPANLNAIGYHPAGESLVALDPRGKHILANPLLDVFSGTTGPEEIHYYKMAREQREGPATGAFDAGAKAGTEVYAPVTGVVAAIRQDPTLQNAHVVEIKPAEAPNLRVYVSLVRDINGEIGPDAPVTAGTTKLGSVADLSAVLEPQLSEYVETSGNHVTVSVLENS
ncbi:MAG: hypothetical protein ACFB50_12120 [Rubrobacteraceae bacterium]